MKKTEVADNDRAEVLQKIAVSAIKFALLRQGIGSDIEFSLKESVSFSGNSGPYIQYTYVRCSSILSHIKTKLMPAKLNAMSSEEEDLLRALSQFSDVIFEAAQKTAPHIIATHLFSVAQKFSLFYEKQQILKADEPERNNRLILTQATAFVLKKGLYLLGIETVEKM